ncbi:hypothetical protein [Isoptericola sp. NPDC055881]
MTEPSAYDAHVWDDSKTGPSRPTRKDADVMERASGNAARKIASTTGEAVARVPRLKNSFNVVAKAGGQVIAKVPESNTRQGGLSMGESVRAVGTTAARQNRADLSPAAIGLFNIAPGMKRSATFDAPAPRLWRGRK